MKPFLVASALAGLAFAVSPAAAQDAAEELPDDVQTAIVYGDDAAPPCPEGMICVIARLPENDRYRIPENLRFSSDPENTAWAQRVEKLELVGRFGTLSCSTAGAGGFLGCTQDLINRAYGERATGEQVRFSELIAAARADRLAQIDETAAEEQERVEQIEREYMERLERERRGELPTDNAEELPQPNPEPADPVENDSSAS